MSGTAINKDCPLCQSQGKQAKLRLFQATSEEAMLFCEDDECPYPFDEEDHEFCVKRDWNKAVENWKTLRKAEDLEFQKQFGHIELNKSSRQIINTGNTNCEEPVKPGMSQEITQSSVPINKLDQRFEEMQTHCIDQNITSSNQDTDQLNNQDLSRIGVLNIPIVQDKKLEQQEDGIARMDIGTETCLVSYQVMQDVTCISGYLRRKQNVLSPKKEIVKTMKFVVPISRATSYPIPMTVSGPCDSAMDSSVEMSTGKQCSPQNSEAKPQTGNTVSSHKVDSNRIKEVGPDRACAEWLMKNGAFVKWENESDFLKNYDCLPPEDDRRHIVEVDATEASITHIGFAHFSKPVSVERELAKNPATTMTRPIKTPAMTSEPRPPRCYHCPVLNQRHQEKERPGNFQAKGQPGPASWRQKPGPPQNIKNNFTGYWTNTKKFSTFSDLRRTCSINHQIRLEDNENPSQGITQREERVRGTTVLCTPPSPQREHQGTKATNENNPQQRIPNSLPLRTQKGQSLLYQAVQNEVSDVSLDDF
uniref:Uncharacterized protein n=1 Tax=Timema bartmani TaxID=61472 RepID=A0A7R9ER96_9NEOP|nr:unnamed protein product [Timema bartmani]